MTHRDQNARENPPGRMLAHSNAVKVAPRNKPAHWKRIAYRLIIAAAFGLALYLAFHGN